MLIERTVIAYTLISIHAPARGAMLFLADRLRDRLISIHAPARGAIGAFPHVR